MTVQTTPEGVTTAAEPVIDQTAEQTTAQNTEDILKRIEFLEKESREAFKQRDEAKRKLKEAEEQKERERLEKLNAEGKFQEVNKELTDKLAALEAEKSQLLTFKEEYDILHTKIRADLIEKLPESKRKFAEKFSLDELREFVEVEATTGVKPGTGDTGRPGGKGRIDYSKVYDLNQLSFEQRDDLAKVNPELYRQLLIKSRKRR